LAPDSVAKRNDARRSRAEAKLIGPPLTWPIWRSLTLKEIRVRLGTTEGCWRRQAFHARGPRRKRSTWSESADTPLTLRGYKLPTAHHPNSRAV